VKRVVVTSSCAAVMNISTTPQLLSELDWNDQAVQEVEEKGREASSGAKYRTSKTLAERGACPAHSSCLPFAYHMWGTAAWDFAKKYKDEIGWDVAVMNPPLVVGVRVSTKYTSESTDALVLSTFALKFHFPPPAQPHLSLSRLLDPGSPSSTPSPPPTLSTLPRA
jgi:nucleoside-diphosphate-sugar epimerase